MMQRIAIVSLILLLASPLMAQGGTDTPDQPIHQNTTESGALSKEAVQDLVQEEVARQLEQQRRKQGSIYSDSRLNIRLSGLFEFEYRQAQHQDGFPAPASKSAPIGFAIDKATLAFEAWYLDQSRYSHFEFLQARSEFEFDQTSARVDEAYLIFNRPLTRWALPLFKEYGSDNLLFGLEDAFWRNEHRVSETYSLLGESLYRDERLQVLYTLTLFRSAYLMAGFSNGTKLAVDGSVDASGNFMLLSDSRSAAAAGADRPGSASRRMEFQAGGGVVLSLRGLLGRDGFETQLVDPAKPFRPNDVMTNDDLLHWNLWHTNDRLSAEERALVGAVRGKATRSRAKTRVGSSLDLALRPWDALPHMAYLRGEYAMARDGDMRRAFWSLEGSFALDLGGEVIGLAVVQPFVRYGRLDTSNRLTALSWGPGLATAPSSTAIEQAFAASDRQQYTAGLQLTFHRSVALVLEYTANSEGVMTDPGLPDSVDNDLWLASFRVRW